MGRRTLLLIASILIAAVGTGLVAVYVRGADTRAREGTTQVTVYFAAKLIPVGTKGSALNGGDSLQPRTVALNSVPGDAVSSPEQVANEVTAVPIVQGAPLQKSMFSTSGISPASQSAPSPGRIGASFELTDPQRVANMLQPGMMVTVYNVPKDGKVGVAVPRVKVLQIGTEQVGSSASPGSAASRAANPNADQVPRTILTFDLKPQDELVLLKYKRDGELALGLPGDQTSGPS